MKRLVKISSIISIFGCMIFSMLTHAQITDYSVKKPGMIEISAKAEKHVPATLAKSDVNKNTGSSSATKAEISPQEVAIKSVDLNIQKIHPDLIRSKESINQEIVALKTAIKFNEHDQDYVKQLTKQLITLKSLKKYLLKNKMN